MENSKILYSMLQQRLASPTFSTENVLQPKPNSVNNLHPFKSQILDLSADQAELVLKVLTGNDDAITCIGEAGSGKSHTLKLIRSIAEDCFNVKVIVVSAMGICAHNVEGKTLHSTFGIKRSYPLPKEVDYMIGKVKDETGKPIYGESYRERVSSIAYRALSKLSGNEKDLLIFVDEFATTPSQYLVAMHQIAEICRPNGNIKWVLIGDPNQALMVDMGSKINILNYPWEDAEFINGENEKIVYGSLMHEGPFLKSPQPKYKRPWKSSYFALLCNHRQGKEFEFINSLRSISKGVGIDHRSVLNSRLMNELPPELDKENCTFIFASNKRAREHNAFFFNQASEKQVYKAYVELEGVSGVIEDYDSDKFRFTLKEKTGITHEFEGKKYAWLFNLTTPVVNSLYKGQRFMITENNPERGLYNGMIGRIVQLGANQVKVRFVHGDYWIGNSIEKDVPENKNGKPEAVIKRLPGVSANGITCNKSLGKTFTEPTVLVLNKYQWPRGVKNSGWVYVALSRVTSVDMLYILCEDSPNTLTHRSLLNSLIYTEPSCSQFVNNVTDYILNSDETSDAVKQLAIPKYSVIQQLGLMVNDVFKLNLAVTYSYQGISDTYNITAWVDQHLTVLGYEDSNNQYTDDFETLIWHSGVVEYLKNNQIVISINQDSSIHLDYPRHIKFDDFEAKSLRGLLNQFKEEPTELLERIVLYTFNALGIPTKYPFSLQSNDPSTNYICEMLNSF